MPGCPAGERFELVFVAQAADAPGCRLVASVAQAGTAAMAVALRSARAVKASEGAPVARRTVRC